MATATDADADADDAEPDTSRAVVKAYVPAYQKERWTADADALDASLSEYVRLMVQAGRRADAAVLAGRDPADAPDAETAMRAAIRGALRDSPATRDDLRAAAVATMADALDALQEAGDVVHGPGGYRLDDPREGARHRARDH